MRNRFKNYVESKRKMNNKNEIQSSPDEHIDQDFAGFPHAPANEDIINPKTRQEKATAAINVKDGEKITRPKTTITAEQQSDGSANAFAATEELIDEEK